MPLREITAEELVQAAERGERYQVLDVRLPEMLAGGTVDLFPADDFVNLVGSKLMALADPRDAGLDPARPVAVVCAHGISSRNAATFLAQHGYDAATLRGGMAQWMLTLVRRELEPPPGFDRLWQFDRIGKGALTYLLESAGEAIAIDPCRNAAPLMSALQEINARLVAVADTHVHADYLSAGPGLAGHFASPYYLHPLDAVYPYDGTPGKIAFSAIADGQQIAVGSGVLTVEHNPGHTEGSVTYRVGDAMAFTGDFVFVHSIGRPDLAGKTAEWTAELFRSLERARARWPEEMTIYPAHYGSNAERRADRTVGAPFGDLLARNEPLGIRERDAFAAWVNARQSGFPDAYRTIKAINVGIVSVDGATADELENGKNQCAVG
jgi:glyoxylase-like metal-dependent hydrolase (beta-lactamase superfamily II)